jgi:hypothetical protein
MAHVIEHRQEKNIGYWDKYWKCKVCGQIAYSREWFAKHPRCNIEVPSSSPPDDVSSKEENK